jgi:hypothetical protein
MRSAGYIGLFVIGFCLTTSGCISLDSDSDEKTSKTYRYHYIVDVGIYHSYDFTYRIIFPIHVDVEKFSDNLSEIYAFYDNEPEYRLVETEYGPGLEVEGVGLTLMNLVYDIQVSEKKDYSFTMNTRDNIVMMYCEIPQNVSSINVKITSELSDVFRDDYAADPYTNRKFCTAGTALENGWNEVEYRFYDFDEW